VGGTSGRNVGKVWKAVETLRRSSLKALEMPIQKQTNSFRRIALDILERIADALEGAARQV
jgi:hypothetical protein